MINFANVAFKKKFGEFNKNVERMPCHTHESEFNKVKKDLHTFFINHKVFHDPTRTCIASEEQGWGKVNRINPIFRPEKVNYFETFQKELLLSENRKRKKIKN